MSSSTYYSCEIDAFPPMGSVEAAKTLARFPRAVRQHIGFALYQAQIGDKHIDAKPLKNVGAGVLEVVSDHQGNIRSTAQPHRRA